MARRKKGGMQTGAAASSYDFSRFKENRERNKGSEETAADGNVGNFSWKNYSQSLQCPWKARGCALCIYPGSFPSWTNVICSLPVQSFTLPYICYLGAPPLKNCPSSPWRQLQGSTEWNDDLVNVCQHSEGTGDVTSKGTSGIFCSGLHEVAVKGGS